MFILLVAALLPPSPHIHTYSRPWSRSSWEGNNTEGKTGSGVCFPSFTPPHPDLPIPSPLLYLYVFSLLACIVLAAEVKALDILMLLFKQAITSPRACFRNTMKYIFLFFSFFHFLLLTAARRFVAAVLNLSQGILAVFSFFSFSLFPDVTLAMLNPPPAQTLSPFHPSLQPRQTPSFYPGGWYQALHRNRPHLTPSDNPALQWPRVKGKCWAHLAPSDNCSPKVAANNRRMKGIFSSDWRLHTSMAAHEGTRLLTLACGQALIAADHFTGDWGALI